MAAFNFNTEAELFPLIYFSNHESTTLLLHIIIILQLNHNGAFMIALFMVHAIMPMLQLKRLSYLSSAIGKPGEAKVGGIEA